jgi:hypothetical protein
MLGSCSSAPRGRCECHAEGVRTRVRALQVENLGIGEMRFVVVCRTQKHRHALMVLFAKGMSSNARHPVDCTG